MFQASQISQEKLESSLARLRPAYDPLAQYIEEAACGLAWEDNQSGALLVARNPERGTHAYDVTLFPPAEELATEQLVGYLNRPIPRDLREFFRHSNGAFLGELSIYGILSRLSRSARAPLDIGMGRLWRSSYAACDEDFVLFASRNVSDDGQIGYFLSDQGLVLARGNEKLKAPADSGSWPSFNDWLRHQLSQD